MQVKDHVIDNTYWAKIKKMNKIKISIIIPIYNEPSFLVKTILSLEEQEFSGYEIIVVDNACLDETKILVEKEANDMNITKCSIRYIRESGIGLHNARHTWAKVARGEFLLYIDDDVIADKNLLSEIITCYSSPGVGCVGGKILPKWEVEPPEWIRFFPKWYLSILDDNEGTKEVQWLYGCNFSIRKDLLFEVGGFNPDAFGDKKLCWYRRDGEIGLLKKVHNSEKKGIYNPNAVVWHFISKNRLTIDYFKERAFKSGIEVSYSMYRYGNYRYKNSFLFAIKLFLRSSAFWVFYFFYSILALTPNNKSIKNKVTSSYYKARGLYEFKLGVNKNLQRFVRKENFLD